MLLALILALVVRAEATPKSFKHLVPRTESKFFLRVNTKVDVVPYTEILAYASGFRLNWDMERPGTRPTNASSQRAHLHGVITGLLERSGMQGQDCLLRAFCEMKLIDHQTDIISKILKVIFKAEEAAVECPADYTCPVSLLSLAYLLYGPPDMYQVI